MTLRRLAAGTALLAVVATSAAAQDSGVNFIGGFVSSTVSISDDPLDTGSRSGFAAGLSITRAFSGGLEFTPELLYVQKGARSEDASLSLTLEFTYIQLALLLRKNLGESRTATPFFIVGPSVGYLLDCKQSVSLGEFTDTADCGDDRFNKIDLGVMGGVGVSFGRVSLSARYDLGFANVAESNDDEDLIKNRAIMVMVGVKF